MADLCWHDTCQQVCIHMFVCKHDEIIGCVKADVWSICQFDFILIHVWFKQDMCLSTVQISNASQSWKEVSGSAAYVSVKFN